METIIMMILLTILTILINITLIALILNYILKVISDRFIEEDKLNTQIQKDIITIHEILRENNLIKKK